MENKGGDEVGSQAGRRDDGGSSSQGGKGKKKEGTVSWLPVVDSNSKSCGPFRTRNDIM